VSPDSLQARRPRPRAGSWSARSTCTTPEKITFDKSDTNAAAVRGLVADSGLSIELRQSKYSDNVVEQDHGGDVDHFAVGTSTRRVTGLAREREVANSESRCSTLIAFRPASGDCERPLLRTSFLRRID
jgi:transposase-like protein